MDETNTQQSNTTQTEFDVAVNTAAQTLDAASMAAQNIADVSKLAGDPQMLANALVWAQKRISELENAVAILQSPAAKDAEQSVESAGEAVVRAIPVSWMERMEALATHAEAALGFRHTPTK
jgi:hypothetical protein